MQKSSVIVLFILIQCVSFGQKEKFIAHPKKAVYFFWGWNRAVYSNSTISLKGDDYNLVLHHVVAHDRPTAPVSYHNYLQPDRLTIPQNNWRIGYFIKDNLALSFGTDHMKYVMDQNQSVDVFGTISREGPYKGNYGGQTELTEDFLTFEHTDGLNYVNLELEKYRTFFHSASGAFALNGILASGAGIMFPKTNVKLLDYERNDRFHVSGFGIDLKAGLEAMIFRHLSFRAEVKGGYINMPDIILHKKGINGKGNQDFVFAQLNGSLGWSFSTGKTKKKLEKESNK